MARPLLEADTRASASLGRRRDAPAENMAPDPTDKKQQLDFANYFVSYGASPLAPSASASSPAPKRSPSRAGPCRLPLPPKGHAAGPRADGRVPQRDPAEPRLLQGQGRARRGHRKRRARHLGRNGRRQTCVRHRGDEHGAAGAQADQPEWLPGHDHRDRGLHGAGRAAGEGRHHRLRMDGVRPATRFRPTRTARLFS